MQPVSIIIPVYNAFEATLECLESVLVHTPADTRIFVIDDCSPEGDLSSWLSARLKLPANVIVSRNQANLGFVGTCNSGMLIRSFPDDVVLLNSDTVVTARWLEKLQEAAFSAPNVGTVTPFTNNGTICSLPNFLEDNQLPFNLSLEEMATLVESVSRKERPGLPTCVGFCVYIRRDLLNQVGGFDPVFGKGYGEENDLSLRGQKSGFTDILDDSTFILHKGSMSFVGDKEQLSKTNTIILSERYPQYFKNVSLFCSSNPLQRVQARILNTLLDSFEEGKEFRILHILHNGPYQKRRHELGGTELHVQDLIANLDKVAHWTLVRAPDCYYLSCHTSSFNRELRFGLDSPILKDLFTPRFFPIIHVHHTIGFERSELVDLLQDHPGLIVSVHDYYSLCPRIFMWTKTNEVCSGNECTELCGFSSKYIEEFRSSSRRLLGLARKVVIFSESSRKIISSLFEPDLPFCRIPHGSTCFEKFKSPANSIGDQSRALKIAFVTSLVKHKGSELILAASKCEQLDNGKQISWHLFGSLGDSQLAADSALVFEGSYERGRLGQKLVEAKIDLVVLPAQCNETFSYTLGEAWSSGLPVIVTPYGALKERVEESGAGWVLASSKPEDLLSLLNSICSDPASFDNKCSKVEKLILSTVEDEALGYCKLYSSIHSEVAGAQSSLIGFLQPDLIVDISAASAVCEPENLPPVPSFSMKLKTFIVEASRQ